MPPPGAGSLDATVLEHVFDVTRLLHLSKGQENRWEAGRRATSVPPAGGAGVALAARQGYRDALIAAI